MANYRLTNRALDDLERLYTYGLTTFGLEQADRYYGALMERFQEIADNPERFPIVEHLWPGLRRSVYGSHSIYYLPYSEGVQIVRVLRSEDFTLALSES